MQQKRLHSDALGENVRLKLTTRALKTIKKVTFAVFFYYTRVSDEVYTSMVAWITTC